MIGLMGVSDETQYLYHRTWVQIRSDSYTTKREER